LKDPRDISIDEYDYELPESRIPHFPLDERDSSKLLIYRQEEMSADIFQNLGKYLPSGATLVFNDTRVIRARLNFVTGDNKPIEIFCLEPAKGEKMATSMQSQGHVVYNCLVGNLRRWKDGTLKLEKNSCTLSAQIVKREINFVEVGFNWEPAIMTFAEALGLFGSIPIPPYLQRSEDEIDSERYQTVYASQEGSVAAPTAGLHFTPPVMEALAKAGVQQERITLHVGAGTFKPVKAARLAEHEMHAEWMDISAVVLSRIAEKGSGKLIAVGTTSLRTLESLYWMGVKLAQDPAATLEDLQIRQWEVYDLKGDLSVSEACSLLVNWMKLNNLERLVCQTQILIAPPYQVKVCDGLITNFHQPRSTLLLLVAAFVGQKWKNIYEYALQNDLRFLSYGDSSLLLK
jgi:S-adenosylmethionine:tRNA ribosyltransferase-isomerase